MVVSVDEAPQQLLVQDKEARAFEWLLSPKMRLDVHKRMQELIHKCMIVHLVPIKAGKDTSNGKKGKLHADDDLAKTSMMVFRDIPSTSASSSSGSASSSSAKKVLDKAENEDNVWEFSAAVIGDL